MLRRNSKLGRRAKAERKVVRPLVSIECLEGREVPAAAFVLSGTNLIAFDTANPAAANAPVAISNVTSGDTLVGIDIRPQNGNLYGLGVNAGADTFTVYNISARTGRATPVGLPTMLAADLPDPASAKYGVDFNPAVDKLRVTTSQDGAGGPGLNFRVNVNNGTLVSLDTPIGPTGVSIDEVAYTNNVQNTTKTALYTISSSKDRIFLQNPPDAGTQTDPTPLVQVPLNKAGTALDIAAVNGFDILPGVDTALANTPVAAGTGLAIFTVGTTTSLYTVNLVSGDSTEVAPIAGATTITGLAVQGAASLPTIGIDSTLDKLVRFNTAGTGTPVSVAITGLAAGESLVGIDYRPATGQLFGIGFDSTSGTGSASLYLVDPQSGAATPVGAAKGISDGAGAGIDLTGTTNFGFDFNPTKDAIRVVTNTGKNFRVSPAGAVTPDTTLTGGTTNATAAAYTNSFGQVVPTAPATAPTTLYVLDAATDSLFIVSDPNKGTVATMGVEVKLAGTTLPFDAVNGFDIPAGVSVTTSGSKTPSLGYATLTVAGVSGLYTINLDTGAATLVGATTANEGLALGDGTGGSIQFTGTAVTTTEAGPTADLTLTRTGGTGAASVTVTFAAGTAGGADYTFTPITVTFAEGQTTATASVPITEDTIFEGNETFFATLTGATNAAVVGVNSKATVTITDNDAAPTLSIADATVVEGNTGPAMLTFTVTLSGASSTPVTAVVNTSDGTATAASDYTAVVAQTITFAPGVTSQTVTVMVTGDTTNEPNETLNVTLTTPVGAAITDDTAVGTITNDDAPTGTPTLSIADATVVEGNTGPAMLTFTVTLSAASLTPVTAVVNTTDGTATAASDYTAVAAQTITFAPGVVSQTVTVMVTGDTTNEPNETLNVTLSAPTVATLADDTGVGTITNDDAPTGTPTLSIADATVVEGNTGPAMLTFTVTLSAASLTPVTAVVNTTDGTATAASDYTAVAAQTITFAPGVVSQTVTVMVTGDTTNEPDETLNVTLTTPVGAAITDGTAVGTITNDDGSAAPVVSIANIAAAEGNAGKTAFTFTVSLSAASLTPVTVTANTKDGTATAGTDYTAIAGQTITFAPGVTSQTVTVQVNGDATNEANETFTLVLSAPTGGGTITTGQDTGTATITNDDDVPSIGIDSVARAEGNTGTTTFTFTVTLKGGTEQPVTVTVAAVNNTATAGSDFTAPAAQTLTFAPGETTKTFAVTVTGDTTVESDETFFVTLSGATNGTVGTDKGVGTILNDDGTTPTPTTPSRTLLYGSPVTAVGAGSGTPTVRVLAANGSQISSSAAFPSNFTGGVRTAVADVNGDGTPDVIVGSGPGTASLLRVLDGVTGKELFSVAPFEASFTGGTFVAAGDVNGDGTPDIVVSPDQGGGPRVDIYSGLNFSKIDSFMGIDDPNFRGGARVAVGDIDGDGTGDLVVAAGFQGGPRVAAFDGSTLGTTNRVKFFNDFFVFEQALRNGAFIAVGDVNGDGFGDIIAGGGPGGGPRVTVFSGATLRASNTQTVLANFFAGDTTNRLGVQIAVKDLDGDNRADLRTVVGGSDQVVTYLGKDLTPTGSPTGTTIDGLPDFMGGAFVG